MTEEAAAGPSQEQLEQFPPPPSFYKLYGPDSVAMEPLPPPPLEGEYDQYGELHTTEDGVAPLPPHIPKVYCGDPPNIDFKGELLQMNKEVLFTFLELLRTVVEAPGLSAASRTQYDTQMLNLALLLWNMHHLLNLMRPYQARATLEYILREQISERRAAVRELRQKSEAAKAMTESLADALKKATPGDAPPG
uniref:Mediator of RNA polymerase II transcription subunit 7 n=1 Tax=Tetraselmis sp. GSL018 TaxID=582737 RepID=A0A061RJN6_9CHLO|mmetsp:Transcript_37765/g.89664  ORF Transcript_37765/g.89664 Transcript_37765/m.89664 type:complete len:193 (+) Transcript_37765:236-814(+)|eukprot:CAMPEP_0177582802 /NCGR_PEP_ID=MMETSP0419_2-20121207/2966_1 /TAXON_ID=582737 /ORGANISM="Tetraselmis sp., Strain GSL018" /LENGTH=192 /DNA_ID=CAMNT_0019072117 /DNA_START=244 /DNA_END=822 /DNA_ORIENTATION=+